MHFHRSHRIVLMLLVAVWQICLPLLAYAHMSQTGTMTQEVCTTMGMKTIVLDEQSLAAFDHAHPSSTNDSGHECCIFHLNALGGVEHDLLSFDLQAPSFLSSAVAQTPASSPWGHHAPPTGPPQKG